VDRILNVGGPLTPSNSAAVIHLLAALLLRVADGLASGHGTAVTPPNHYGDFIRLIDRHFTEFRSVSAYAARLGYSTHTLNRLARTHGHMTAKQLIDSRIMLEAKRLLVHRPTEPVAAVAQQLGFSDAANFSKYFTQRAGRTPATFRRTHPHESRSP
jgi:AraC-like DNA-binding protein